ncbi:Piso0_003229 [Millerozyma farinosa CBS 7064]|uniref:Piso0_003229 protein n=1 Tax=Pichia sorbitophila (strain ATCC MYA-4447 / BCRC 22081 / CBS 7064 / NBRC 10061 / NRRL Y-12695) TaxID=559304 RepID=G8YII5_PICSO|nr:Piso0_003229 [Millerozyma farinosa CBS 7064]CCE80895.1 Piso0_003229 [Millerozyma farinosa CBS 7064]
MKNFTTNGTLFMLVPAFLITSDLIASNFSRATAGGGIKNTKARRRMGSRNSPQRLRVEFERRKGSSPFD